MGHTQGQRFSSIEFPGIVDQPVNPHWPFAVSAQCLILRYFRELLAQRSHVWDDEDIEAVHEIRVAARRTRTALQTFSTLWPDGPVRRHLDYLAKVADAFTVARDTDVMQEYLQKQLKTADGARAAALLWLQRRAKQRRKDEQPRLEKLLLKSERSGEVQALVDYFSRRPYDLWSMSEREREDAAQSSAQAVEAESESSNEAASSTFPEQLDNRTDSQRGIEPAVVMSETSAAATLEEREAVDG